MTDVFVAALVVPYMRCGEEGAGSVVSLLFTGDVSFGSVRRHASTRTFASGGFVCHVLNPGAPGHAIVFFESQPTIPGAPGFEDVLEEAKDFASDTVTRLLRHAVSLVPSRRESCGRTATAMPVAGWQRY